MKVTIYLDIDCSQCEEYLKESKFWSDFYGMEYELIKVDDDPSKVFHAINEMRKRGQEIEHLPVLAISQHDDIDSYCGILAPTTIETILRFKKYE